MEWKNQRLKKKILVFKPDKDNDVPVIKMHVTTVTTMPAKAESP